MEKIISTVIAVHLISSLVLSTDINDHLDPLLATTRLPSLRHFDLDNRITVSGVEIRFSDTVVQPVHALYGLRYASLGGEIDHRTTQRTTGGVGIELPAAKRRFMHSVAAFIYETPARGHLHKSTMPPVCPQLVDKSKYVKNRIFLEYQSEDCLTLNVFIPEQAKSSKTGLPVVIFVHGESYVHGSGNENDFGLFASLGNFVAVTLNYRLGLLGFLSGTTAGSNRGNFALLDLQAAIQWVHTNIHRLGGDPGAVTLMGHSHGASLVHLFAASMLSMGPNYYGVKRIVMLDGSADAQWATSTCDTTQLKQFLESHFNLNKTSDRASVFDLLQDPPLSAILAIQQNLTRHPHLDGCLYPSAQKHLHGEKPTLWQKANVLYGQSDGAGSRFYLQAEAAGAPVYHGENHLIKAVSLLIKGVYRMNSESLTDLVNYVYAQLSGPEQKYQGPKQPKSSEDARIREIFTDALFWSPAVNALRQRCGSQVGKDFRSAGECSPSYVFHVSPASHRDILSLALGEPFTVTKRLTGTADQVASQALMHFLSNFIHSGDPNKLFSIRQISANITTVWPVFNNQSESILHINRFDGRNKVPGSSDSQLSVAHFFRERLLTFWSSIFPKLIKDIAPSGSTESFSARNFDSVAIHKSSSPSTVAETTAEPPKIVYQDKKAFNRTFEFPSVYSPTLVDSSGSGDKRMLLLTLLVGLSLFLVNIVFAATFYVCLQRKRDRSDGILIPAADADTDRAKSVPTMTKPAPEPQRPLAAFQQPVVKLPALEPSREARLLPSEEYPIHPAYGGMPNKQTSFQARNATPLSSHRVFSALDADWKTNAVKYGNMGLGAGQL